MRDYVEGGFGCLAALGCLIVIVGVALMLLTPTPLSFFVGSFLAPITLQGLLIGLVGLLGWRLWRLRKKRRL